MEVIEVSEFKYKNVVRPLLGGLVFHRVENGRYFVKPISKKVGKEIHNLLTDA